jgi:cell division protein FtsB
MNEGLLNAVLVLAAVFFVVNTALFIVLIVAVSRMMKAIKEMQPRLRELAAKVEKASEDVSKLSRTVQGTVNLVGLRAMSVAESAQGLASLTSRGLGRFSPYLAGALTLFKAISALRGLRRK